MERKVVHMWELPPSIVRTHSSVNLIGVETLVGVIREILAPTRIASVRARNIRQLPTGIIIPVPKYTDGFSTVKGVS